VRRRVPTVLACDDRPVQLLVTEHDRTDNRKVSFNQRYKGKKAIEQLDTWDLPSLPQNKVRSSQTAPCMLTAAGVSQRARFDSRLAGWLAGELRMCVTVNMHFLEKENFIVTGVGLQTVDKMPVHICYPKHSGCRQRAVGKVTDSRLEDRAIGTRFAERSRIFFLSTASRLALGPLSVLSHG
jgi:hypothetical protein